MNDRSVDKYTNDEVNVNINDSVYWDFYRRISDKFVRVIDGRVDSDVGDEVEIGDGEGVELEVVDEVGSGGGISVDKIFKGVRCGVGVGVGGSVSWGVDRGAGYGVDITYRITFGLNYGSEIGSFDGFLMVQMV